jgi:hypothetical protein
MSESERDYREGLEALQADMARHQRRFAPEVTADANQRLAVETIERLEKQDADARPSPPVEIPVASAHDRRELEVDGRKYTLERTPDRNVYRTASEFEAQVIRHAKPRIDMLMTKRESGPLGTPSWQTRTMAAMYFKVKSLEAIKSGRFDEANVYERAFQQDLYDLLEASNLSFGDWRKDAPTKITVSG